MIKACITDHVKLIEFVNNIQVINVALFFECESL